MSLEWIDSHCHLDFENFNFDLDEAFIAARTLGVTQFMVPGVSVAQWSRLEDLSAAYTGVYFGAGIHPWWVTGLEDIDRSLDQRIEKSLVHPKCIAIGECGLDGLKSIDWKLQLQVFERHLRWSKEYGYPLIVHSVKAHSEVIRLLKKYRIEKGGVIHGFSGSLAVAKQYHDLGFYLGVGGTITYDRAKKTRNTMKEMPLAALVLETDSPDMPLQGYQGQRNSPQKIPEIAQCLANLRNEPLALIAERTTKNARTLFSFADATVR